MQSAGLKSRVVTALILGAAVASAVVYLPTPPLAAFFYLFVLVGGYEWANLAGVSSRIGRVGFALALAAAGIALWFWPAHLWAVAVFWGAALALVACFPRSSAVLRSTAAMLVAGALALGGAWVALVALRSHAAGLVIWLLLATVLADTAAYFAGRRFGRRKLAPAVSPGKTWEGLIGAALATLAWAAAGAWFFDGAVVTWLGVGAAVVAAAVVGDLFESALKRTRNVKDSGTILPGHGGVLDRIDSLLAAAPVFALLML